MDPPESVWDSNQLNNQYRSTPRSRHRPSPKSSTDETATTMNRQSSRQQKQRQKGSRSNSKLYERYNVNVKKSSSRRRGPSSHFNNGDDDDDDDDDSTNFQKLKRQRSLLLVSIFLLVLVIWSDMGPSEKPKTDASSNSNSLTKLMEKPYVWPKNRKHKQQQQQGGDIGLTYSSVRKRWNPCLNTKYELERHDHEPRHGDICRARGGLIGLYECPEGCHETAGNAPFCSNDGGPAKGKLTMGDKGGPCRVKNPNAAAEYRCDYGAACIMAVGTPLEQFKGKGKYFDDTCDNQCGDGRKGELTAWFMEGSRCANDMDCSLSGVCQEDGTCKCEPWAEGLDCSYLKFEPVDKARLGYLNEDHSSWGASVIQKSNGMYHMYVSEIICKNDNGKRCGLNNWETHSRIVQASSGNIEGPYQRLESMPVVLPAEHHNPSLVVSPTTGDWHLFSISGPTGPIERMISKDEGESWGIPMTVSPRQNPGPLMKADGSTLLFYRADGLDIPYPTCSNEGISVQNCPSDDEPCEEPKDTLVFGHTGEDPSVFVDHRGYYHMLFNALPYKCVPKFLQGGHAWSLDGINWKNLRVGAFDTTIQFTDGTNMKCERRERPQMVVGKDGRPVALISAVTGCPKALGDANSNGDGRFYRGADDSFTLIQKMGTAT